MFSSYFLLYLTIYGLGHGQELTGTTDPVPEHDRNPDLFRPEPEPSHLAPVIQL